MTNMGTCDKCGRQCEQSNDAVVIEAYAFNAPLSMLVNQARHFLPVIENGVTVCPGSPSRAQYMPGQPRDPRYAYNQAVEAQWRAGYAKAQEL